MYIRAEGLPSGSRACRARPPVGPQRPPTSEHPDGFRHSSPSGGSEMLRISSLKSHQIEMAKPSGLAISIWCSRRDLNPHAF